LIQPSEVACCIFCRSTSRSPYQHAIGYNFYLLNLISLGEAAWAAGWF